jgi:3',5'-cyclic AMP phosphodiesterase CpdA
LTKISLIKRIFLGFILVLGFTAAGWYSVVWYQSRITGDRPVYLQMVAPNGMTLRWGTEIAAADTVYYGLSPDRLEKQQVEAEAVVNHRLRLTGLQAETRYYYRIQHQGQWLQSQPEWFVTAPVSSSTKTARIWVVGDPGKYLAKPEVLVTSLSWLKAHAEGRQAYADILLTTGDNAYPSATTADYLREFFTPYRNILKNIPLWTAYGNHDARRWAYYKLFDTPLNGESGGLPSGSRHYYSFDYGPAHIIILDNHHFELAAETAMTEWLQKDIQQSNQKWIITVFHHPPYTGGTYDSDNERQSRGRMKRTREYLLPVLEKAGVDLVINGHSHVYERSHLIHCHYGLSKTFSDNMILDSGTVAAQAGNGEELIYSKSAQHSAGYAGTMYMVLGSSGEGNQRGIDHPALPFTSALAGSVVLDVSEKSLSSRYITAKGTVEDRFRLIRSETKDRPVTRSCP